MLLTNVYAVACDASWNASAVVAGVMYLAGGLLFSDRVQFGLGGWQEFGGEYELSVTLGGRPVGEKVTVSVGGAPGESCSPQRAGGPLEWINGCSVAVKNYCVADLTSEDRRHDVFGERIRGDDHVRLMIVALSREGRLKADAGDPHNLDWPGFVQVAEPRRTGRR